MSDRDSTSPGSDPHHDVWSQTDSDTQRPSRGARLLARRLRDRRGLIRTLIIGDAIGERPATSPRGGKR